MNSVKYPQHGQANRGFWLIDGSGGFALLTFQAVPALRAFVNVTP